jgi:hypothetical protein
MARELSQTDIRILKKLAPECEDLLCSGSGEGFRSILPPVANHYSAGEADFGRRLEGLSDEELRYMIGLMRTGEESIACVPPELAEVLFTFLARRCSDAVAREVEEIYNTMDEC